MQATIFKCSALQFLHRNVFIDFSVSSAEHFNERVLIEELGLISHAFCYDLGLKKIFQWLFLVFFFIKTHAHGRCFSMPQILSKADDNTVMEAVDSEVSVTCTDMSLVKKTFQLALLCTKRYPSERPTMHEVARVLVSLLPPPPAKPSSVVPPKQANYAQRLVEEAKQHKQTDSSLSDAQWFVKFGEVISKSSL